MTIILSILVYCVISFIGTLFGSRITTMTAPYIPVGLYWIYPIAYYITFPGFLLTLLAIDGVRHIFKSIVDS